MAGSKVITSADQLLRENVPKIGSRSHGDLVMAGATGALEMRTIAGLAGTGLESDGGSPASLQATANLRDISGLSVADGTFIVGDGSNFIAESGATARASMGANNASNLTTGTLADARVTQSNVIQHEGAIDHDALTNFVANEHINHSGVSITAGNGLTGGGDLTQSRTLAIATDGVGTNEIDQSIAPTWTGTHTFRDALFQPASASDTPLLIRGAPSQSGHLTKWQDSAGNVLSVVDKDGNVGIGESGPDAKLEVRVGASGKVIKFLDENGNNLIAADSSAGEITFGDPNDNRNMVLDSFSDQEFVMNHSSNDGTSRIKFNQGGTRIGQLQMRGSGESSNPGVFFLGTDLASGIVQLQSGENVTAMTIDENQNVGIGTSNPSGKFHISGDTASDIQSIIQGASSQSANLTEWQDVNEQIMTAIGPSGRPERRGDDGGGTNRMLAAWSASFVDSAAASFKTRGTLLANDFNGEREAFRFEGDGSQPLIGFFGGTAVAKQSALTAKDASTVDSTYGAEERDVIKNNRTRIEEIEARLQNYNLVA